MMTKAKLRHSPDDICLIDIALSLSVSTHHRFSSRTLNGNVAFRTCSISESKDNHQRAEFVIDDGLRLSDAKKKKKKFTSRQSTEDSLAFLLSPCCSTTISEKTEENVFLPFFHSLRSRRSCLSTEKLTNTQSCVSSFPVLIRLEPFLFINEEHRLNSSRQ